MRYAISYVAALAIYIAFDAAWLTLTSKPLYRAALGDMLLPDLNAAPAIAFYLVYPIGLAVFAIGPALRSGTVYPALLYGALFGALAYATYDLTNFATLKNWTMQITVADIAWGAFASATVSAIATLIARRFA